MAIPYYAVYLTWFDLKPAIAGAMRAPRNRSDLFGDN